MRIGGAGRKTKRFNLSESTNMKWLIATLMLLLAVFANPAPVLAAPSMSGTSVSVSSADSADTLQADDKADVKVVKAEKPKPPKYLGPTSQKIGAGMCGPWYSLQYCIYLNRSEQLYAFDGSVGLLALIICGGVPFACAVATVLAISASRYMNNRGSICPSTYPRLRLNVTSMLAGQGGKARCVK